MSDPIDDRIRELYAELDRAAPPVPPLPSPAAAPRLWQRRWRLLLGAGVVTIAVIASVPILLGGGFFGGAESAEATTTIVAAETSAAPTTTNAAATTAPATTTTIVEAAGEVELAPDFEAAVESSIATEELLALPPNAVTDADGLLVDALVEFSSVDGPSAVDVVVTVENGAATMIRGFACGVEFGPPPMSSSTGVIVNSPLPDVRLCSPGEQVATIASETQQAMAVADLDGRPVVALRSDTSIDLLDILDGGRSNLVTYDPAVETPIAVSHGDGLWVVSFLSVGESSTPAMTRYGFFNDAGSPITVEGNPAATFADGTEAHRMAALTPDGTELVFVVQQGDLSEDVVVWDLATGSEVERYRVVEASAGGAGSEGGEFVGSLDASDDEIVVNVFRSNGENHPERILRVDRISGSVTETSSGASNIHFQQASFLD